MPIKTKTSRTRKLNRNQKKKAIKVNNKLPSSFVILGRSLNHLWNYKKLYLGIFVFYLILYTLLVKGLAANFELSETKDILSETYGGDLSGLETASTLFGTLLGTTGTSSSEAGSVYQIFLYLIFSLVIIWSLRSTYERKEAISIKQAFYSSSYPLIPFVLVCLVIVLQLIPALLGMTIYGVVISNGIAVAAWEQILWLVILLIGIGLSIYYLSSSIFASYIVTLPKLTPIKALRSAKKLVKYRRFSIIRKILFLPLATLVFLLMVFLPLAFYLPLFAEILFVILSLSGIFVLHAYFYTLYRELL